MPNLGVFLILFFPHPLSLSQRERECLRALSQRERECLRPLPLGEGWGEGNHAKDNIRYASPLHYPPNGSPPNDNPPNDNLTINPMAATATPSMAAIHLSKPTFDSAFDSAIAAFVSALN